MEIIDCHIHPALDADTNYCRHLDTGDFQRQMETLKRLGISRACGSVIGKSPVKGFDDIRRLNDMALRLRDAFPDFFIPGVHAHPHFPEESCAEIERACNEGCRWIGELVGYKMGYGEDFTLPGFAPIMELAAAKGTPVNFHCGDNKVVESFAAAFPNATLVLAHPNDGDAFLKRVELLSRFPNLYLDTSGTGIDRFGMLSYAMRKAGDAKILLGSDYPINNPAIYVHGARFEPLSELQLERLFTLNFKSIAGLP